MNLTYINVTFTGKVLRWKLYLQDKNFNLYHIPGKEEHRRSVKVMREQHTSTINISGTGDSCTRYNNGTAFGGLRTIEEGHWGLDICRRRLGEEQPKRGERGFTDRMIKEFIRQCPACQVMNRMRVQIKTHRFTKARLFITN